MHRARRRAISAHAPHPNAVLRWLVLAAASVALIALALSHSASVGAASPSSVSTFGGGGTQSGIVSASPYPPNTALRTYVDPRYCDGLVSVVTDSGGNLINVCTTTGQRIFPVFPDFGFGAGFVSPSFVNGNFNNNGGFINNGGFVSPSFVNGNFFNNNGGFINGNGFNGNGFNGNFINENGFNGNGFNTFPAGGTVVGGTVFYNDNRFCGDGKLAFVPGRGYFCQNGAPLFRNGATTVNCDNFFVNGCGVFRPFEVASTPATQTAPVTTYAAPAPKAAAPAATVTAPAAPAPVATTATAPNAPAPQQAAAPATTTVKVQSVPAAPTTVNQQDDHRG